MGHGPQKDSEFQGAFDGREVCPRATGNVREKNKGINQTSLSPPQTKRCIPSQTSYSGHLNGTNFWWELDVLFCSFEWGTQHARFRESVERDKDGKHATPQEGPGERKPGRRPGDENDRGLVGRVCEVRGQEENMWEWLAALYKGRNGASLVLSSNRTAYFPKTSTHLPQGCTRSCRQWW